jgi:cytoskeletal protein CcmA (bactofilin family)
MTTFLFPNGIDTFTPQLINDTTVVNAYHVLDLRQSLTEIEQALVGITTISYDDTAIIIDGDNVKNALEKLDKYLQQVAEQLGFVIDAYGVGFANRVEQIEHQLQAHRDSSGPIDSEGYQIHGVIGQVVGTLNPQDLINKKLDSGIGNVGTKIILRTQPADGDLDTQFVIKDRNDQYALWVNSVGDTFIAGNLQVTGDRIVKGTDVVQNHLQVDGSTVLGNNTAIDTVTINGQTTLNNNVSIIGNLTQIGNLVLNNPTHTADLQYNQLNITSATTIIGDLTATSGIVTLGNGADPITISGPIFHTGTLYNSGGARILGNKFIVQSNDTVINTDYTTINSDSVVINDISINNGNVVSNGTTFVFGDGYSSSTNTFIINGTTTTENLLVLNNLQVALGSIIAPQIETMQLTINTGLALPGYVWTATNIVGSGTWQPLPKVWKTSISDGYGITANCYDEIFVDTTTNPIYVTLPNSPQLGDRIRVIDSNSSWNINPCYVNSTTATIMGALTYTLNVQNDSAEIIYNGTEWRVIK